MSAEKERHLYWDIALSGSRVRGWSSRVVLRRIDTLFVTHGNHEDILSHQRKYLCHLGKGDLLYERVLWLLSDGLVWLGDGVEWRFVGG